MKANVADHTVVIRKTFPIDRKTLFAAFTESQKMQKWFFIERCWNTEVKNTLKVGEKYSIKMLTHDGLVSNNHGVYKEIDPPKRLVFTWAINESIDSLVKVDFELANGGTKITLTHDSLPNESYYCLHLWSWQHCLENLRRYSNTLTKIHKHAEIY